MQLALLILYSPAYYHAHAEQLQLFASQINAHPPDTSIAVKRIEMILAHDVLDRLENISSPTCIVVGDQDVVTPAYFSEELKQHIAHRELHVISGAGHSVHAEKPEAFFAIVRDFIERLTAC